MLEFLSRLTNGSSEKSKRGEEGQVLNWIIKGVLAVGPIPKSKARQALLRSSGISSVLTLCSEEEGVLSQDFQSSVACTRIPLSDSHSEEEMSFANFSMAVDKVHSYIQSSAPLYVHCIAGMERSPSVCVGYLYKYKQMDLWEALNWVKQANPRTNILDSQLKVIQRLRT